jgi:hypothetical protein
MDITSRIAIEQDEDFRTLDEECSYIAILSRVHLIPVLAIEQASILVRDMVVHALL